MGNQGVNKTQLTVSKVSKQHTALLLAPSDAADHQSTSRPGGLASCPAGSSQFSGLTFATDVYWTLLTHTQPSFLGQSSS